MQEIAFSGYSDKLCPIVYYLPGGFLNVMPRCSPITHESLMFKDANGLDIEQKLDSFGYYNGKVVAVDYGS